MRYHLLPLFIVAEVVAKVVAEGVAAATSFITVDSTCLPKNNGLCNAVIGGFLIL